MAEMESQLQQVTGEPLPLPVRRRRPWPVTANALLLVLQAGGFLGGAAYFLGPLRGEWLLTRDAWVQVPLREAIVVGTLLALLALLALASTVGMLRLQRGAWVTAVMVQGAQLLLALMVYFRHQPLYVYGMMVYGIFMVLYLHQADVQAAFRQPTRHATHPESTEATRQ